jgi:thioredoxin reductase (NADPH)
MGNNNHYHAIIIGGGPAGLTAGIYLSRAKLKTLILDSGTTGGQMLLTHEIANYPGVENISGYQLASIMKKQAISFGCEIKSNTLITEFKPNGLIKEITTDNSVKYTADTIILAPGGKPRPLNVSGEDKLKGKGISYCATCDGDFFSGKKIIVVGGGNSALEEAVSLTKYADKVTIIHQFNHFQAFNHAISEAKNNNKIEFIMESAVNEFNGDEKLESIDIRNINTGNLTNIKAEGAFIFIGYIPNTEFLKGLININQYGEIQTKSDMSTDIEGVFAAGDCTAKKYRQITTAVSDGTIASLSVVDYVHKLKNK